MPNVNWAQKLTERFLRTVPPVIAKMFSTSVSVCTMYRIREIHVTCQRYMFLQAKDHTRLNSLGFQVNTLINDVAI